VPDLFIIGLEKKLKKKLSLACDLRKSGFWVETDTVQGPQGPAQASGSLGRFKSAHCRDNELASGKASEDMAGKQQKSVDLEDLLNTLKNLLVMEAR